MTSVASSRVYNAWSSFDPVAQLIRTASATPDGWLSYGSITTLI